MKRIICLFVCILTIQSISAQIIRYSNIEGQSISKTSSRTNIFQNILGDIGDHSFELIQDSDDKTPYSHSKFQQYYKGIEVMNSQIIIHSEKDVIKYAFGNLISENNMNTNPSLSISKVENLVLDQLLKDYQLQNETGISYSTDLIIAALSSHPSRLAYRVEARSNVFNIRHTYIVDAVNGIILEDHNLMCQVGVPVKGMTTFYGLQDIVVDSIAPDKYDLRDPERNIVTLTNKSYVNENISTVDNLWEAEENIGGAIDAHYGAIRTYDFLLDHFGFQGINNAGMPIVSIVQLDGSSPFNNAFWDGLTLNFGAGDCNHNPTTSIDVVAHEYMHGVIEFTSGLGFNNESAGINEGLADIMGKAVEYENHSDSFDWMIGSKLPKNDLGSEFRNMQDPWEFENPKYYDGQYYGSSWHNIGSVFGHWYYLLVEGGPYSNEVNESYDLNAISRDDAIQIIFVAMTQYALPKSKYRDFVNFTQLAAEELFGENSLQYSAVTEAWQAVGLGKSIPNFDLSAKVLIPYFACISGEALPISVEIFNLGDSIIPAGTILNIEIKDALQEIKQITLDDSLFSDEKITIPISEGPIITSSFNTHFINAEILIQDDVNDNNLHSNRLNAVGVEDLDLILNVIQIEEDICSPNVLNFNLGLINKSCTPLEKGRPFVFNVYQDETLIYSTELVTNKKSYIDQSASFIVQIPYSEEMDLLTFNIADPSEPSWMSNEDQVEIVVNQIITEELSFSFDNVEEYEGKLILSSEYSILPSIFEGESMLGMTGGSDELITLCQEINDLFDDRHARIVTSCLDFSNWVEPTLTFDLVQIRNTMFADQPNSELHNVTKVEWNSPQGSGLEYIYDQPDGEVVLHEVNLPSQYVGEVEFSFYHMTGERQNLLDEDYTVYDFTFIDNIAFKDKSLSSKNLEQNISIYPNPVSTLLNIKADVPIRRLEIYSIIGRKVMAIQSPVKTVDISELSNGLYFLKGHSADGVVIENSFVKI